jgi:endonuclease/exonuclease/phosphatase family metal-dependent hydrolase
LRLEEAKIVRGMVEAHLQADPDAKLIVLGDFNDVKDSESTKAIIGRGKFKLTDTRPAERNGDTATNEVARFEPRNVTWTHYYGKEDTYSRIDYILLSTAMARQWVKKETYILRVPNWGVGSDHRPIVATFKTADE